MPALPGIRFSDLIGDSDPLINDSFVLPDESLDAVPAPQVGTRAVGRVSVRPRFVPRTFRVLRSPRIPPLSERVLEFTKSMKNGTKPFDFPPRNERSRTDVPHGTGEISHGPDRRAMADPSKTSAAAFAARSSAEDLPSRGPRRDQLRCSQRLPLAASASRISQLEDSLRNLPRMAQRRDLAEDSRHAPGHASASPGTQEVAQRGDYRQSNRQDDRGRRPAGLRCRKEDQWTQASYRCRYTGPDPGRRRPSRRCSGPGWRRCWSWEFSAGSKNGSIG